MPSSERIPSPEEGAKWAHFPPEYSQREMKEKKRKTYLRAHSSLIQKWSYLTPNPGTKPLHTQETLSQQLLVSYYSCSIESVLTYGVLVWYGSRSAADRKPLQRMIETRHHQLPPSGIFIHKNTPDDSCSPNTYTLRQLVLHLNECLFVLAL